MREVEEDNDDTNEDPIPTDDVEDQHDSQVSCVINMRTNRQMVSPRGSTKKQISNSIESDMLKMLSVKQHEGTDKDVTFAKSLVPFLKRINEAKKLDAHIDVLQALRK